MSIRRIKLLAKNRKTPAIKNANAMSDAEKVAYIPIKNDSTARPSRYLFTLQKENNTSKNPPTNTTGT
jgi:hypothetical protein